MNHNLTPSFVMEAEIEELAAEPADVLAYLQRECAADLEQAKNRVTRLEAAIAIRYGQQARAALAAKGGTGTVHIDDGDFDVAVAVSKTVEWDEDNLFTYLESLPVEDARHYAKLKVSVEEKKYAAAPPAIRTELERFRTVKPGRPKFTFTKIEERAA